MSEGATRWMKLDRRTAKGAAAIVTLMALGFVLIGFEVAPVALLAILAAVAWRRDPGRPLAFAACVMLVVAALGTAVLVPVSSDTWSMSFAADRELAADAGRLAGVLVAVASVLLAYTERSPLSPPRRGFVPPGWWARLSAPVRTGSLRTVRSLYPIGVAGFVLTLGAAIRLILAPRALAAVYDPLLMNLRLGTHYSLELATNLGAPASLPPLAPVTIAYLPLAPRLLLVIAGLATMVVCGQVGNRLGGVWAGVMTLAIAAVLPSMWDAPLSAVLAGLCLIAAVALVDGRRATTTRVVCGGLAMGMAVLARPETVLVLPMLVLWSWDRGAAPRRLWQMSATALVTMAPWWVWIHQEVGGFLPTSSLASFLNDPVQVDRHAPVLAGLVAVVAIGVAVSQGRRARLWRDWWILLVVPLLSLALAATDLPGRDPLGWSAPLVVVVLGVGLASWLDPPPEPERKRNGSVTGPLPLGPPRPHHYADGGSESMPS